MGLSEGENNEQAPQDEFWLFGPASPSSMAAAILFIVYILRILQSVMSILYANKEEVEEEDNMIRLSTIMTTVRSHKDTWISNMHCVDCS